MRYKILSLVLALSAGPYAAFAESEKKYHLFNPVPYEQMRPLSTDRPDKTESPYTVDAGRFQIEMDFANYTYDKHKKNGEHVVNRGFGIAPINMKAGLTENMDLQIIVDNYVFSNSSDKIAGERTTKSGFGDVTIRLKRNIFGNDEGDVAFGVMPYVKIPTTSDKTETNDNDFEYGANALLAVGVNDAISLGFMAQVDIAKDEDDVGYHPVYIGTATIGHALTDKLGHYTELYVEQSAEGDADTVVTVDIGMTYLLKEYVQLDAGVNIGVTEAADDFNPFVGLSYKF
jgi:hypothetical protein